jgi:hypothetical protein
MSLKREAALPGAAWYNQNNSTDYSAVRWQRVSPRRCCPICHHATWCLISPDEVVAGCMRIDRGSFKTARTRGGDLHLHRLRDHGYSAPQQHISPAPWQPSSPAPWQPSSRPRAPIDHRHAVYTAFLDRLTLSPEHAAFLLDTKGFHHETLSRNLYATAPARETISAICTQMAGEFDLGSTPGFYDNGNGWTFDSRHGELLLPCRDHRERITAILRRTGGNPKYVWASATRHGGPSSGAPLHFALPYMAENNGEIIITEGILKADVIAERLRCAVIGIAGVSSFGPMLGNDIRTALPAASSVYVAFDADEQRNQHVRTALVRLLLTLYAVGYFPSVLQWDEGAGKGLDDILLRGAS